MKKFQMTNYVFLSALIFVFNLGTIVVAAMGKLPFSLYDFIFFLLLLLSLALYQPRYMFWLFVSSLPLENIILSPAEFPISVRLFQAIGGVLIIATLVRWLRKKSEFRLLSFKKICVACQLVDRVRGQAGKKRDESEQMASEPEPSAVCCPPSAAFGFFDRIIFLLPAIAIVTAALTPYRQVALKQSIVLLSFAALYWLARNYMQTKQDIAETLWFFLLGAKAAILFAFYQTIAAKFGWPSHEVMPGRVNGTFTEPDWLGMFLVLIAAGLLWVKLYYLKTRQNLMILSWNIRTVIQWMAAFSLLGVFIALLMTVARSAWVGLAGVIMAYLFLLLWLRGDETPAAGWNKLLWQRTKLFIFESMTLAVLLLISGGIIVWLQLSSFHFTNRAASSISGQQKITVSCQPGSQVPTQVAAVEELPDYGCRHINLEEIEAEKSGSHEIREIYRPDPNVEIRKNIYGSTWKLIMERWLIGYGLGSSALLLGQDERGTGLNASNIFLEAWLTMGIAGLVLIISILILLPLLALVRFFQGRSSLATSLIILTSTAFVLPNLFNAGLLIGFFWLWLAAIIPLGNQLLPKRLA